MTNQQHIDLLRQGVNAWRQGNPGEVPDLNETDLRAVNLSGANLSRVNLSGSSLSGATLSDDSLRLKSRASQDCS
jgi:uncharacterized protein YjbI with pentapeptide repeats